MIVLGTPSISLNFGIPEWMVVLILIATYFLYRLTRLLYVKYRDRSKTEDFSEQESANPTITDSQDSDSQ